MNLPRFLPYTLPLIITTVFVLTADTAYLWTAVLIIFLVAALRKRIGKWRPEDVYKEYCYFHFSKEIAILKTFSGFYFVMFNAWILYFLSHKELASWQLIIFIYSAIIINSNFAISLAHDLMHSQLWSDRLFSRILLLQNGFFYLENDHLYTHHRYVATSHDPASALKGESLYKYLIRSVSARFRICFFPGSHFPSDKQNRLILLNYTYLVLCILYLIYAFYLGWQTILYLMSDFLMVTLIYESVTYIQHYGLKRNTTEDNRYEPVRLHHSWNCYYRTSAYMHYMMPVHSIHHLKDDKNLRFQGDYGLEMPLPFASMIIAAWQPGKWSKLMDKSSYFHE